MNKLFISIALMAMTVLSVNAQWAATAADVKPLMVGQAIPDIMLVDGSGASKSLHSVVGDKPTLIMFYRGDWCTNCINHFNAEIVPNLSRVNALGYNVMFIGPDNVEWMRTTAGKINVSPSMIYSDAANSPWQWASHGNKQKDRLNVLPSIRVEKTRDFCRLYPLLS